jgi:hypothetical protein
MTRLLITTRDNAAFPSTEGPGLRSGPPHPIANALNHGAIPATSQAMIKLLDAPDLSTRRGKTRQHANTGPNRPQFHIQRARDATPHQLRKGSGGTNPCDQAFQGV